MSAVCLAFVRNPSAMYATSSVLINRSRSVCIVDPEIGPAIVKSAGAHSCAAVPVKSASAFVGSGPVVGGVAPKVGPPWCVCAAAAADGAHGC